MRCCVSCHLGGLLLLKGMVFQAMFDFELLGFLFYSASYFIGEECDSYNTIPPNDCAFSYHYRFSLVNVYALYLM